MTTASAGSLNRSVQRFQLGAPQTRSIRAAHVDSAWDLLRTAVYGLLLTRASCDPLFNLSGGGGSSMGVGAIVNVLAILIAIALYARRPLAAPFAVLCIWGPFLAAAFAATLYAPEFGAAARLAFNFVTYWSFFAIPFFIWRDARDVSRCILLIMASSVVPSLYAMVDILGGLSNFREFRLQSTFSHPNIYAFYIVLLLGLALCARSSKIVRIAPRLRLLLTIYIPYLVVLLMLTKTRSAWLACGFIFAVYAICIDRKFLAGLLLLPVLVAVDPSVVQRLTDISKATEVDSYSRLNASTHLNSYVWRQALWESALPQILDKAFIGHGLESFKRATPSFFPLIGPEGIDGHNLYLQVAFEMGLVGLFTLIWLLGSLAYEIGKLRHVDLAGATICLCILVAYALECYSDNMQFYLAFNWYFWFAAGTLCASVCYGKQHAVGRRRLTQGA